MNKKMISKASELIALGAGCISLAPAHIITIMSSDNTINGVWSYNGSKKGGNSTVYTLPGNWTSQVSINWGNYVNGSGTIGDSAQGQAHVTTTFYAVWTPQPTPGNPDLPGTSNWPVTVVEREQLSLNLFTVCDSVATGTGTLNYFDNVFFPAEAFYGPPSSPTSYSSGGWQMPANEPSGTVLFSQVGGTYIGPIVIDDAIQEQENANLTEPGGVGGSIYSSISAVKQYSISSVAGQSFTPFQ